MFNPGSKLPHNEREKFCLKELNICKAKNYTISLFFSLPFVGVFRLVEADNTAKQETSSLSTWSVPTESLRHESNVIISKTR